MPVLDLTHADMIALNEALLLAPFGRIAPLIEKINEQLRAQRPQPAMNGTAPESVNHAAQ